MLVLVLVLVLVLEPQSDAKRSLGAPPWFEAVPGDLGGYPGDPSTSTSTSSSTSTGTTGRARALRDYGTGSRGVVSTEP
jgi:hypothetical protein